MSQKHSKVVNWLELVTAIKESEELSSKYNLKLQYVVRYKYGYLVLEKVNTNLGFQKFFFTLLIKVGMSHDLMLEFRLFGTALTKKTKNCDSGS